MTEIQTTLDNKNLKGLSPNTIPAMSHSIIPEIGIDPRIKYAAIQNVTACFAALEKTRGAAPISISCGTVSSGLA
jgi:hypothetical protein